jgi:hypothetical protein
MAATSVIFVGWNKPNPGLEAEALESFSEFLGYLGEQQGKGGIESFEPVLLSAHGGDMNGFVLVRGDRSRLDELRRSERFLEQITRANILVGGFGVVDGWVGEGLQSQMARFQKFIPK